MPVRFAHLHLHSEYSLVDSTIRIPDLVKETSLASYSTPAGKKFVAAQAHTEDIAILSQPTVADDANRSLFKEHRYDGHKWATTTDMSRCIG